MAKRIGIGALLVGALVGVYLLDQRVVGRALASRILLWTMAIAAYAEIVSMVARKVECNPGLFHFGGVAVVAVVVPSLVTGAPVPGALLALAVVVAAGLRFLGMAPVRSAAAAFPEALLLGGGVLYTAGLLSFLDRILIESIPRAFAVIAISKTSDVCGFFAGSLLGKRPIAPAVSPKKTWLGTMAGVAGAAGVGLALRDVLDVPGSYALAIGALLGAASFLGDLIASGLKRWCGVKDSAALLPEFGGCVDMLDGVLVAAPVAIVCLYQT